MSLSRNTTLELFKPSGIRRFSALAAATPGCISLTIGEPGEDTPTPICNQVDKELVAGNTHYPPNIGTPELRSAIAVWESARGMKVSPDGIVVTVGATEAISAAMLTLMNPGDEVIIPEPAYLVYRTLCQLNRGVVVPLDTSDNHFQIDAEQLKSKISGKTKLIVLTSPNNPTGCVYTKKSLDAVAELARKHGFYVLCDDVYRELTYAEDVPRFAELYPDLADRCIVTNSFSKPWAMTGWRLGWVATSDELAADIGKVHAQLVSSVPSFLQPAALYALSYDVTPMRTNYQKRRQIVLSALSGMGLPVEEPGGAFYAFPSIKEFSIDSEAFCERAIKEFGVALVPGVFFGAEGYVRISYAASDKNLTEGLSRLKTFVNTLREEQN